MPAVEEAEVTRRQPRPKQANGHPQEAPPEPEQAEAVEPGDAWEPDLAALDAELARTGYSWDDCRRVLRKESGRSPMAPQGLARADHDLLLARLRAKPDKAPLQPEDGGGNGNGRSRRLTPPRPAVLSRLPPPLPLRGRRRREGVEADAEAGGQLQQVAEARQAGADLETADARERDAGEPGQGRLRQAGRRAQLLEPGREPAAAARRRELYRGKLGNHKRAFYPGCGPGV
jgi:hypothetical protein